MELDLFVAALLSLPASKHRLRHKDKIKLLQYAGSFTNLWRLLQDSQAKNVRNEPRELETLRWAMSQINLSDLKTKVRKWRSQGIGVLSILDPQFPDILKNDKTSISLLYYRGRDLSLLTKKSAAIVGSRALSAYGHEVTAVLAENICRKGYCLVSGAAEGADSVAHQTALDLSGETIAVLGCGVDIAYPRRNQNLLRKISEECLVISEYRPGTPPIARNFPARNRIIAALADTVIVTSAKERSGSLLTAKMAHKLNKKVYAVPGSVFDSGQKGCHALINDKVAKIVTDLEIPDLPSVIPESKAQNSKNCSQTITEPKKAMLSSIGKVNRSLSEDLPNQTPAAELEYLFETEDLGLNADNRQLTFFPEKQGKSEVEILRFLTTGAKTLAQISKAIDLPLSETAQTLTKLEISNAVNRRRGHYELSFSSLV